MKVLGLTGGCGTGKSTVAQYFVALGATHIDADQLVHALYQHDAALIAQIAATFGADTVRDGIVDRPRLAQRIFHDASARRQLEQLVHPRVRQQIEQQLLALATVSQPVVLLEIPLLFETTPAFALDGIVVAHCAPATQLARVMARHHGSAPEAQARIAAQLPVSEKVARADYAIDTDGTLEATRTQVAAVYERVLST